MKNNEIKKGRKRTLPRNCASHYITDIYVGYSWTISSFLEYTSTLHGKQWPTQTDRVVNNSPSVMTKGAKLMGVSDLGILLLSLPGSQCSSMRLNTSSNTKRDKKDTVEGLSDSFGGIKIDLATFGRKTLAWVAL